MSAPEFEPWPKIARLNREMVITEKIDGTNAAVLIVEQPWHGGEFPDKNRVAIIGLDSERDENGALPREFHVYAQSRNKFITPGKSTDNYGFASWVQANAEALVETLGEGRHFGEWWGSGIQRGYDMTDGARRFSLFNTHRWGGATEDRQALGEKVPGLDVVPVLYRGPFSVEGTEGAIFVLKSIGSFARAGFENPEGIVVWHEAARISFKVTLENDAAPFKTSPRRALDLLPSDVRLAA